MISYDVETEGSLQAFIGAVRAEIEATPEVLTKAWGPKLVRWQQENIERGRSPDGAAFADFAEGSRHRAGARPLATGNPDGMSATMDFDLPRPGEVRGGATVLSPGGFNYPEAHQKGTVNMVARPWSGLRPENETELEQDMFVALTAALERANGR